MIGDVFNSEKNKKNNAPKKYSFLENVQNYFTEYSQNTGLHGFRYLGEQKRTIIEKVWWLISLSIALYFCTALIIRTYQKWESSPVIVSFATKETPIWQIPFPAVTICPETKSVPKVFNYTNYLYKKFDKEILSQEEETKLSYVSFLCSYQPKLFFNLDKYVNPDDLFEFFEKVAPNFIDNISECFFMGKAQNCSDIFTPIITDEGLCYSFNLLDREDILSDNVVHHKNFHSLRKNGSEWSLEHGYRSTSKKNTYPRRALHAGALFDFELKLRTSDEDLDFICGSSIQGYKIQIHHPAMLPRVKQQHFRIPLDQALIAAMMPSIMTTSEAIKAYTPDRRQCFLPSERSLKYFKIYTQHNCQIECKTNYTMRMCGCVDFYMPRENGTNMCGAPLKACMMKAEDDLLSEGIDANIMKSKNLKPQNEVHKIIDECNCMPECTAMTYIIENTQSEWDWVRRYQYDRNATKFNKTTTHMSYLQIFFKGNQFITSERNELYGPTDFLANFGGLLGLFTGFSMLSSIEVLYYLTLRLICNIKLFGSKNWSGKD